MADDIRRLSEELAGDPGSLAFIRLGELLRLRGDLADAARIAARGRERHPTDVGALDLVARVAVDMGDVPTAMSAWEQLVQLDPKHAGALKGLAFVAFRDGRLSEAALHLTAAAAAAPEDASIAAALAQVLAAVAPPTPPASAAAVGAAPRARAGLAVFDDLRTEGETVLLLDAAGHVLAASAPADTVQLSDAIGASLAGVSDEASRATRHLGIGAWTAFTIEGERASACLAPAPGDGVVVVTAPRGAPMGAVRRVLQDAAQRARAPQRGELAT